MAEQLPQRDQELSRFLRKSVETFHLRIFVRQTPPRAGKRMKTNQQKRTQYCTRLYVNDGYERASSTNSWKLINFANVVYVRISTDLWSISVPYTFYYYYLTNANSMVRTYCNGSWTRSRHISTNTSDGPGSDPGRQMAQPCRLLCQHIKESENFDINRLLR